MASQLKPCLRTEIKRKLIRASSKTIAQSYNLPLMVNNISWNQLPRRPLDGSISIVNNPSNATKLLVSSVNRLEICLPMPKEEQFG